MCDTGSKRDAFCFNGSDIVCTAVPELACENAGELLNKLRIVKQVGSINKIPAQDSPGIGQSFTEFFLKSFYRFIGYIRNKLYAAFCPGRCFEVSAAGKSQCLTRGFYIFTDA